MLPMFAVNIWVIFVDGDEALIVHHPPGFDKTKGQRDNPRMRNIDVVIKQKKGMGIEIPLPKAPLVLAHGKNGFVMCGYLNVATAEKLGVAAAMVRGVSTVDDLLAAKIVELTTAAKEKGIEIGMTGRDALAKLL
jgi:uncharacterized protein YunC (DUF1805 family)